MLDNDDTNGLSSIPCTICGGYVDDDGICRSTSDLYPCSIACPCGLGRASCHSVPVDASMTRLCDQCCEEILAEARVESLIAASPAGAPIDPVVVSRLAVEAALGESNLLNGRDPREDGVVLEEEPLEETEEIEAMTNFETVYGKRGAA